MNTPLSYKRILKELNDVKKNIVDNCSAGPINDDDIYHWSGTIIGPSQTPYEGGLFYLDILFPIEYPFKPPSIKFRTPIYHPNIHQNGSICLDILKNNWSAALTIVNVLLSISSLLSDPNPNDPLSPNIAKEYKTNYKFFFENARKYTRKYANA